MASGNTKISLQTEIIITLKTIITTFITIGGLFWGYHEWVLDKRLESIEGEVNQVELKIDRVYDHMIGMGGAHDHIETAEKPMESDENKGNL